MHYAEPTTEARLAAVLTEWHHHREAIEAVKAMGFVAMRVVEAGRPGTRSRGVAIDWQDVDP